ncbi:MAG: GDP-mannose 4,6-dehydratase [Gemmatimonadaceae bacterium]
MKSALITGVSGQDGSYLAEHLLALGYRVTGTVHAAHDQRPAYFTRLAGQIELAELDVRDRPSVSALVRRIAPTEVYHLAAQSRVGASWDDPVGTADVSGGGALNVLEAVRTAAPNARVLVAGSCEVFGHASHVPQDESTPHQPASPYAVAKSFAQGMTRLYRERFGLHASTAILFNHESPRRAAQFVSQKIARGAAAVASGAQKELRLGNVQVVRDWGFAGDFVQAMWRMLQADVPADLVIGTGVGHSVWDLCEAAFQAVGLEAKAHVVIDPLFVRQDDAPALVANPAMARERLQWSSTVDFNALVRMLVAAAQDPSSSA